MHEYYEKNRGKLRKTMEGFLSLVGPELEQIGGKPCGDALKDIWRYTSATCWPISPISAETRPAARKT